MPSALATGIDATEIAAFRRDGFVHLKGLLDVSEIAAFRKAVDAAVAKRKRKDTRALAEKTPYEQSFIQCQYLWEEFADVRPLTFHPKVVGAAAALIGADAMRVWHDQALYKEAGGRETDAHQDHPYWPIAETDTITAWIPFDGSTLDNGAMGYVPGSHLLGWRKFVNIFTGEPEDILASDKLCDRPPVFVEVPAGSVALHHGMTFHVATP